jgi:tetratricopeptide (TPR) repeat protein
VESYELREEIQHGGRSYFIRTSYLPQNGHVQTSFFVNGDTPSTDLRKLTKDIHQKNRDRFRLLLDARAVVERLDDPLPHLKIAQMLFKRNLFVESIQEAQSAIVKGSKDSLPYFVMGASCYRLGEYEKAFEYIQKGVDINPEYPDLHNLMGLVYLSKQRCAAATECFKRAIGLNIYYGEPYFNLARAYVMNAVVKEDYELSRDLEAKFSNNIERACQLNPFIPAEAVEKAKGLLGEERYEEALKVLDGVHVVESRGGIDDIILELYLMFLVGGEDLDEKAIEGYLQRVTEIVDHNPSFADGYNSLGILYTAKCKILMDRASQSFRKALEINSKYKKAQKNLRLAENDRQGIFILLKALLD